MDQKPFFESCSSRIKKLLTDDEEVKAVRILPDALKKLQGTKHSIEALAKICEIYSERAALGERAFKISQQEIRYLDHFSSITYGQMWTRIVNLASYWANASMDALHAGDRVGVLGYASIDYVVADLACLYLGATAVPLLHTYSPQDLGFIISDANLKYVVCTVNQLEFLIEVVETCPSVKSVFVMDLHSGFDEHQKILSRVKEKISEEIHLTTFVGAEAFGARVDKPDMFIPAAGVDPLMTILYTSGSTGFPKGAVCHESYWSKFWCLPEKFTPPTIPHLSVIYLPLGHLMSRAFLISGFVYGGVSFFTTKSDMSNLFEEIKIVRPTVLQLIPRISEAIYQFYQMELSRRGQRDAGLIKNEMRREFLGSRLVDTYTSSAPTVPEVKEFFQECFEVPLVEFYGSTEAGMITMENKIIRESVSEYKLVDVPDLGYKTTDKPWPRGELYVKTSSALAGYLKNPERSLFDPEGFLKTGDIFEDRGSDILVWVDRKNNVLKLSQGEFVTISRLEKVFSTDSSFIKQIYIYGNSTRSYLLAVVVPDLDLLQAELQDLGQKRDRENTKAFLRSEINRVARSNQLRAFEIPRDIIVETEAFSIDNNLLTGLRKPSRQNLKKKYGQALEELYSQIERTQIAEIVAFDQKGENLPADQKVQFAIESVLGVKDIDLSKHAFADLGGDSLRAVSLSTLIKKFCGVEVPVSTILNPGGVLNDIQTYVQQYRSQPQVQSFKRFHDSDREIFAKDLRLERYLTPEELATVKKLTDKSISMSPKQYFLTGATGFLGRFLCLDLLKKLEKTGGKVHCVVRAPSDDDAYARLQQVFSTDSRLQDQFAKLAENHLVVHAGDLAKPKLGLSKATYDLLAGQMEVIVHPGALVNHSLSYAQLFEPNVLGTVELIRFAIRDRFKPINYVSTFAVVSDIQGRQVNESEDIRQIRPRLAINEIGYAEGYTMSKWAGEVLLRDLYDNLKLPVAVFRVDMIMPHTQFRGQANGADLLTRLLMSLINTGIAPESFYKGSGGHFDGLPVDVIAEAIAASAASPQNGFSTYQVSNSYWDDGISLDSFVDWIQSAGWEIKKIKNYRDWYKEFAAGLERLDQRKKNASSWQLSSLWEAPGNPRYGQNIETTQFREFLKNAGLRETPHVSEQYIFKYLRDMCLLGLIEEPSKNLRKLA